VAAADASLDCIRVQISFSSVNYSAACAQIVAADPSLNPT
jgi:hypothetical protein